MDSGLVIVTFITVVYIIIMFSLLFYVKYEWCDLLFKNNTVGIFIVDFLGILNIFYLFTKLYNENDY